MSQGTAARVALTIEPLTRETFAPSGDVIELEGAKQFLINQGTAICFHDLANVDVDEGGHTLISLSCGQPRAPPFEAEMLECHSRGSQVFIPRNDRPHLVVVAPAGELDPSKLYALVSCGWQGVNYARGVRHHPLLVLGEVSGFLVASRGDEGHNYGKQDLAESIWLTAETTQAAL